jgi:hypothetical protein
MMSEIFLLKEKAQTLSDRQEVSEEQVVIAMKERRLVPDSSVSGCLFRQFVNIVD